MGHNFSHRLWSHLRILTRSDMESRHEISKNNRQYFRLKAQTCNFICLRFNAPLKTAAHLATGLAGTLIRTIIIMRLN